MDLGSVQLTAVYAIKIITYINFIILVNKYDLAILFHLMGNKITTSGGNSQFGATRDMGEPYIKTRFCLIRSISKFL